jgi:hypothetical protein
MPHDAHMRRRSSCSSRAPRPDESQGAASTRSSDAFGGIGWVAATMKVLEGLKAIDPGTTVPVAELGLPVAGTKGLLLVFWKST